MSILIKFSRFYLRLFKSEEGSNGPTIFIIDHIVYYSPIHDIIQSFIKLPEIVLRCYDVSVFIY